MQIEIIPNEKIQKGNILFASIPIMKKYGTIVAGVYGVLLGTYSAGTKKPVSPEKPVTVIYKELAKKTRLTENEVRKALKKLEKIKTIKKLSETENGAVYQVYLYE